MWGAVLFWGHDVVNPDRPTSRRKFSWAAAFTLSVFLVDAIAISLPHATILGVEQKQVEVLAFENGFWNRISAADLESQLATLPDLARQKAAESGILAEAETALQTQLNERIHAERPVRLTFQDTTAKD